MMRWLLVVALVVFPGSKLPANDVIDTSIYERYTKNDPDYGAKPTNQFREFSSVKTVSCEGEIAKLIANSSVKDDMNLHGVKILNCLSLKKNAIAFVGLNVGLSFPSDGPLPFYHGFIYVDIEKGAVSATKINITTEDLEVGGYTRSLWDVIVHNNQEYFLILLRSYESYNFELYKVNENELIKIDEYDIGGL